MENLFFEHECTRMFDLKGLMWSRHSADEDPCTFEEALLRRRKVRLSELSRSGTADDFEAQNGFTKAKNVLQDENFVQLNNGRPFPLRKRAKEYLEKAVYNDSMFLSAINVVDYSILAGIDEQSYSVKFGIIDYMRQYDIIKKMEHMGKSVGMLTGQAEPTIIEPQQYRRRFQSAIDRYFMEVPDKWSD
jgi:hypothetical protein